MSKKPDGSVLRGFCDADWGGELTTRRSTTDILLQLGNNTVYWQTRRQSCVALSSTESEYIALSEIFQKVVWMRELLQELGVEPDEATHIGSDNRGAMTWASEIVRKSKHVQIRRNYVKEQVDGNVVTIDH